MKKWVVLAGMGLLGLHLLILMLYNLPYNKVPPAAKFWSVQYVEPVFDQNWKLFAPDPPGADLRFSVQYVFSDGSTSDYCRPFEEVQHQHRLFRLIHTSKIRFLKETIAGEIISLSKEYDNVPENVSEYEQRMLANRGFLMLMKYLMKYGKDKFPEKEIKAVLPHHAFLQSAIEPETPREKLDGVIFLPDFYPSQSQ